MNVFKMDFQTQKYCPPYRILKLYLARIHPENYCSPAEAIN